jgi:hypothetical protein
MTSIKFHDAEALLKLYKYKFKILNLKIRVTDQPQGAYKAGRNDEMLQNNSLS